LGDNVTFLVTVDNLGPDIAEDVFLSDLLPAGLTFVSAQPSLGSYDAVTGVWSVGDMAPVQLLPRALVPSASLTIVARADAVGTFTNTASSDRAQSFPFDPDLTNNQATAAVTVALPPVDLSITKTVSPAVAAVGESMVFTMVLTNAGPGAAVDVIAADELPPGLTPTAVSDPACTIAGSSVSCAFGVLAAGARKQFTVTAIATVGGAISNIAMVSTANPETNPGNNVASATANVIAVQPPTPLPPPPNTLPATGSGTPRSSLWIGGAMVLAGLVLAGVARRRRWT
jgi:uncharacterized repeat protein (TIGR01451 family)/LPXTG-motif cell wall-anchored protein